MIREGRKLSANVRKNGEGEGLIGKGKDCSLLQ
jgi:hypothetical protein